MSNQSPLRLRRISAGFTQAALASAAGISQQLASKLENGHVAMTPEHAKRFASILGCSALDLLPDLSGATPDDQDEMELVLIYREMPDHLRENFLNLGRTLLAGHKAQLGPTPAPNKASR